MARKIITARTVRNAQVHGLRKFVFRQILVGRTLRPSMQALCIEITNVVAARSVLGGHETKTQEIRRFRDSRFSDQPAEYTAQTMAAAIAQFEAEFPKFQVVTG